MLRARMIGPSTCGKDVYCRKEKHCKRAGKIFLIFALLETDPSYQQL